MKAGSLYKIDKTRASIPKKENTQIANIRG